MRVLVVDDEPLVRKAARSVLEHAGYAASVCENAEQAREQIRGAGTDLILLDLSLPDVHGLDFLSEQRAAGVHTPVLVVSGDSALDSRLAALQAGADDYLVKPYNKDELLARLAAVARRDRASAPARKQAPTIGPVTVDTRAQEIWVDGRKVMVTMKEYAVLEVLAQRPGMVVSKDGIINALYPGVDAPQSKIVDVFVCKLRKKLSDISPQADIIRTAWSRGYYLQVPGDAAASTAA